MTDSRDSAAAPEFRYELHATLELMRSEEGRRSWEAVSRFKVATTTDSTPVTDRGALIFTMPMASRHANGIPGVIAEVLIGKFGDRDLSRIHHLIGDHLHARSVQDRLSRHQQTRMRAREFYASRKSPPPVDLQQMKDNVREIGEMLSDAISRIAKVDESEDELSAKQRVEAIGYPDCNGDQCSYCQDDPSCHNLKI